MIDYRKSKTRGRLPAVSTRRGRYTGDRRHFQRHLCQGMEPLEQRWMLVGHEAMQLFNASPALFVANEGQWEDASIRYAFNGAGANVLHTDFGPVFQLFESESISSDTLSEEWTELGEDQLGPARQTEFSVYFDGAEQIVPTGLDQAAAVHNFQVGDSSTWRSGVPTYETVVYPGLYEGIDLYTWGRRDSLKYEFHVAPGVDYRPIQVSFDGIDGLWLDDEGALHVTTELTELVDDAPYVYQMIDGVQVEVAGEFVLVDADTYTFEITGSYDPSSALVIDPVLAWSTDPVGDPSDYVSAITVDSSGNVLLAGSTPDDALVSKLSVDGELLWSTILGGDDPREGCAGVTIAADGDVLVVGSTFSNGWVSGGYRTSMHGSEGFVVKLDSEDDGAPVWSTYVGGKHAQSGSGIALDAAGDILVLGTSGSSPAASKWLSGGFDITQNGLRDVFVAKLSADGQQLLWGTLLGGEESEGASAITVAADGNILVTGDTRSSGWISAGLDDSYGGEGDAFVAKIRHDGQELLWARYLGGSDSDFGHGIAVDRAGDDEGYVTVVGTTYSADWHSGLKGERDAYVVRLTPDGQDDWSTLLGGSEGESGFGIALDEEGNALVTGRTSSPFWVAGGFDTEFGGTEDAFVAKVASDGQHIWSTYLGENNSGADIAIDENGNALVTGNGSAGVFVAKIVMDDPNNTPPVADPGGPYFGAEDAVVHFDASGSDDLDGDTLLYTWDFGDGTVVVTDNPNIPHTYLWGGDFTVTVTVSDGRGGVDAASTTASVSELNDQPLAHPGGPYSGFVGNAVTFDASASSDWDNLDGTAANDQELLYNWDFGDGSSPVTTSSPTYDYTYATVGDYVVTLAVNDGQVGSPPVTTLASIITVPITATYVSEDTPLDIPDQSSVTSTIEVDDSYEIGDLTADIDIDHARLGDLTIKLTSPADTWVYLAPTGGHGAAFIGEDVGGTWTLEVIDGKKKKDGTLLGWSLIVTPATAAANLPGDSSQAILAVGAMPETFSHAGIQTGDQLDADDPFVESEEPFHPELAPALTNLPARHARAIDDLMMNYGREREASVRHDAWVEELPWEEWGAIQIG